MLRTILIALLLAAPLLAVAAPPTASAHVCVQGWQGGSCDDCPDLGLFHDHPSEVGGIRFNYPVCVLP